VRIGGDVLEAKIIRRVIPVYPALAKQIRLSGIVRLMGVIGEDGTVQNLQVLGGHPVLVPAAVEAVKQWLYRPTLLNGNPVAVAAPIEVHFILK
jgi:protein TonB